MHRATLADQLWEATALARKNLKFLLKYQTDFVELNRLAAELRRTADTLDDRAASYATPTSTLDVGGEDNVVYSPEAARASET